MAAKRKTQRGRPYKLDYDFLCSPWEDLAPWDRDENGESIVDTWKEEIQEEREMSRKSDDFGLPPVDRDEEERAAKWLENLSD